MAWRVLNPTDIVSNFIHTTATIAGESYQLGLTGWHIVVAADNHPEFVWATVDHVNNAVSCADISSGKPAYDFTSQACAQNKSNCNNLNTTLESTDITLPDGTKPNDICQVFPYGTVQRSDITTADGLNIALIKKLNNELQNTIFKAADLPASLTVWANYQFTGALWINDITQNSTSSNQRGSLELANTVMETSFQGTVGQANSSVNCFGCHQYKGTSQTSNNNTENSATLSHIFDDIKGGQCVDVQTSSVVNSQSQATNECPTACTGNNEFIWNGQWSNQNAKTGAQLPMTVCSCCPNTN
jgi:hypothetical protein